MKIVLFIFGIFIVNIEAFNMFGNGFPFNNDLGASIRANVDNMVQNMNAQINQQMGAMNRRMADMNAKFDATRRMSSMVQGEGGSSVVTYNGKSAIIKNHAATGCTGQIVITENGPVCNGNSFPVNDICLPGKSYSQMNDQFCIFTGPPGSRSSASIVNGQAICENGVLLTSQALQDACGPEVLTDNYALVQYFPNLNDPNHVMPSNNPNIPCKEKNSNICEFYTNFSGIEMLF